MTRLQFCTKCGAKRLREVKKQLQRLFASKDELKENVCSICCRQLYVGKTAETKGTSLIEVKKGSASVASALEGGGNRADANEKKDLNAEDRDESCRVNMHIRSVSPCIYMDNTSQKNIKHNIVVEKQSGTSKKDAPSKAHRELRALKREVLEVMGNSADEERPYQCSFCDRKPFAKIIVFLRHVAKHTGTEPITEPFQCRKCNKSFGTVLQWCKHTGEKPYVCELCGHATKWPTDLKIHMKTHTGEQPYQCEQCGQCFVRESNLRRHKSTVHEKIKTKKCRYCDKEFRYIRTWKNHEKTHPEWTGVREHVCEICGKDCQTGTMLEDHINRHNNLKPYVCEYCHYSTSWSNNLLTHVKRNHKDCRCSYCGMRFTSYEECKDHKRICRKTVKVELQPQVDSTTSSVAEAALTMASIAEQAVF